MRTVTVEFLRHGHSFNQLLSPLTPYLAVCDSHEGTTLHFPLEHQALMMALQDLRYLGGVGPVDESAGARHLGTRRKHELINLGRIIGQWFSEVSGISAAIGNIAETPVHLKLVLSAQELAMLPFEIAVSSTDLPGPMQHLLLQNAVPICLTRESRRAARNLYRMPRFPKVLFVFVHSSQAPVPYEAHLAALRRAVEPWVSPRSGNSVQDLLDILPNPTLSELERTMAGGRYTHVHILTHGSRLDESDNAPWTLVLRRDNGGVDAVSGRNLARALRPMRSDRSEFERPVVVTIAACDSAATTPVPLSPGDSILHALHESGIPLVIGSQFPLTFSGSVALVDVMYPHLLAGHDPRMALLDLRRQLAVRTPFAHDWASIVCYASFDGNFSASNREAFFERLEERIRALFANLLGSGDQNPASAAMPQEIDAALSTIAEDGTTEERANVECFRAGFARRQAIALYRSGIADNPTNTAHWASYNAKLNETCEHLLEAFRLRPEESWVLTQVIRERLLAEEATPLEARKLTSDGSSLIDLWRSRYAATRLGMQLIADERRHWLMEELLELLLLRPNFPMLDNITDDIDAISEQLRHSRRFDDIVEQIRRYTAPPYSGQLAPESTQLAERALSVLNPGGTPRPLADEQRDEDRLERDLNDSRAGMFSIRKD